MNSRSKGAKGEREAAHSLGELLGVELRRGQQFCGANGDADVVGIAGFHVEVKRNEHLNIHGAVDQAERDAKDDAIPLVYHRKNSNPWLVTFRADRLPAFVVRMLPYVQAKSNQ